MRIVGAVVEGHLLFPRLGKNRAIAQYRRIKVTISGDLHAGQACLSDRVAGGDDHRN